MTETPPRREFLKKAALAAAFVAAPLVAGIPAVGDTEQVNGPRAILTDEERSAWKARRKNIVRGYEPEYHDEFP